MATGDSFANDPILSDKAFKDFKDSIHTTKLGGLEDSVIGPMFNRAVNDVLGVATASAAAGLAHLQITKNMEASMLTKPTLPVVMLISGAITGYIVDRFQIKPNSSEDRRMDGYKEKKISGFPNLSFEDKRNI